MKKSSVRRTPKRQMPKLSIARVPSSMPVPPVLLRASE
jgi:hypothetical protein